jgi:hypothetical protein
MIRRLMLILFLIAWTGAAWAEPQFSVLFGQSCFLCHQNPTGRSERSLYGSQFFAPTYLPPKPVNFELLEKIKPQVSESVLIGADLRTIWMSQDIGPDSSGSGLKDPINTNRGTMAQMEGYLYLTLQPTEKLQIFLSKGISEASGRFEAYGMGELLPFHGYAKVGQFQENYGWAFADHTAFVRTGLLEDWDGSYFASPLPPTYGVGAEVGVRPYRFDITGSFTNPQTITPVPFDTQKRWIVRGMVQQGINDWGLQGSLGGSYLDAPRKGADLVSQGQERYGAWGGFGGIGWQGLQGFFGKDRLGFGFLSTALLFEYDRKAWTPPGRTAPLTSSYSTTQLNVMVYPGVWINGMYDWMDNNDYVTGLEAKRTSIGMQIFPLPWVDIQPRYRLYSPVSSSPPYNVGNYRFTELQVHFMF